MSMPADPCPDGTVKLWWLLRNDGEWIHAPELLLFLTDLAAQLADRGACSQTVRTVLEVRDELECQAAEARADA